MDLLTPGTTFATLVDKVISIFDKIVPVLIAAALLFFFWGIVKYIKNRGDAENRKAMVWGLVALFIILSVWGILRLACASLVGDSSCSGGSAITAVTQPCNSADCGPGYYSPGPDSPSAY